MPVEPQTYNPDAQSPACRLRVRTMRNLHVRPTLLLSSLLAMSLVSPAYLQLQAWTSGNLTPVSYPSHALATASSKAADLDGDGEVESLTLVNETAFIRRGDVQLWRSPADWNVLQASVSDFDHDGLPEASLLLWREFAPWPVDRYLRHPGRIDDFHDRHNQSCHLILIGWRRSEFREIWAGSALADPIVAFSAADIDGDERQELIALEGRYDRSKEVGQSITIWDWNGFGFSLRWRGREGNLRALSAVQAANGKILLLVQGNARR